MTLERHLQRFHPELFADYGSGKAEVDGSKKRKLEESGQKKLDNWLKPVGPHSATLMKHCVDLVTVSGRPFKIFSDPPMKAILALAAISAKPQQTLNATNIQKAVLETAKEKRAETIEMLKGKMLSLMLDMATCMQRSFLGEFLFNLIYEELFVIIYFLSHQCAILAQQLDPCRLPSVP